MRDAAFRKSSFSGPAADCVEVGVSDGLVRVRDTKARAAATLSFTPDEWDAFIRGVKSGEFDFSA